MSTYHANLLTLLSRDSTARVIGDPRRRLSLGECVVYDIDIELRIVGERFCGVYTVAYNFAKPDIVWLENFSGGLRVLVELCPELRDLVVDAAIDAMNG